MSGATVTVRGTAVVPGKPDEIELWLEVTALEQSPAAALAPRPVPVRALMATAGEPDLPVQAGDLDVSASVDVTVALEEP